MFKRTLSVLAVALLSVTPAFAHSHPTKMSPDKGATVAAPTEISVEFSEALEPKFSSLTLVDSTGATVSKVPSVVDAADAKHQTLAVPTLAPGVYTVKWVTTALDGHHLEGSYTFTVK